MDEADTREKPNLKPVNGAPKALVVAVVILSLTTLSGAVFALISWNKINSLEDDLSVKTSEVNDLNAQVESLKKSDESTGAEANPTEIEAQVGESVTTDSGSIVVDSYSLTSQNAEVASLASTTRNILKVNLTLTNSTDTAQTYSRTQFYFATADGTRIDTSISELIKSWGGNEAVLEYVSLEPNGSRTVTLYLEGYDGNPGTFSWANSNGQTVKVSLQ